HTKMLTPQKIEDLVEKLISGKITHQEVHQDKGHGAWVVEPIETFESLVATGPQRKLLQKTPFKVHKAAPAGDVMMAGPAGLIKSVLSKNKSKMEI
ncbi:MAG: DUF1786 family protein, partial [Methanobacteriaceae archaeon]|nr:DUF1786 family protein [Methanobacteriaceae archaeon]